MFQREWHYYRNAGFASRNLIAWLDTATNDLNISSAGWETVTTKSRLNALLDEFRDGAKIFQKNWEWFFSDFGTVKPFVDGMKV